MPNATEISTTAAHWLIRLEGNASPELWDEFQHWVYADLRHRAEFIRLRTGWARSDTLKLLRPADGTIDADLLGNIQIVDEGAEGEPPPAADPTLGTTLADVTPLPQRRYPNPSRRRFLAAAAALATVAIGSMWYLKVHGQWEHYATEIGGRQEIILGDGSTVELNTDSQLRAKLSRSRRDLVLVQGEALFHVAHDRKRPFYVQAAGTVVRAVGTEFSVRIRDGEHVSVLVKEGLVAVGRNNTSDQPLVSPNSDQVAAGEGASVGKDGVAVKSIAPDDMLRRLSWTAGRLSFQGVPLSEAVAEFNRYNRRHLLVADPSIVEISFGGNFRATDPESFVETLEHSFGVRADTAADGTIELFEAAHSAETLNGSKDAPPKP
ncbi:MAG TPA: FecR domain-containing protein [Steroidobacteraceae bacterium]|jgi:transmembrane sensor